MTMSKLPDRGQVPWLDEAWRLFGVRETRGPGDHPDVMALYRAVGHPGIAHDETPWCAAFVGACLERSGIASTRSLMARSYSGWGRALSRPRPGAIVVLSRGSDPVYGHVGFWVGETASKIFVLGGNQSNAVTVAVFDKKRLLDVRWPDVDFVFDQAGIRDDGATVGTDEPLFAECLEHILEMEGGYSNDPYDPGGPTNRGITLKVFAGWRGERLTGSNRASLTARLKKISSKDVAAIYRKNYWRRAQCADFAPGLALMHFDCAVNQGVGRAIKFLQRAVETDVDGEIGPLTRAAAARMPVTEALERYAGLRRKHYRSLHHFWRFGRGWLRRVTRTLERAHQIAAHRDVRACAVEDELSTQPNSLEKEADMPTKQSLPTKSKWWGHSMTIWGVVVTTLSTVLPTLGPVIGVDLTPELVNDAGDQLVKTVQAVSALIGTLMTIYGRARAVKPLGQRAIKLTI